MYGTCHKLVRNFADLQRRFLEISTGQFADFREPSVADYTQKHCWVSVEPPYIPAECSTEGLLRKVRRRLHGNLRTPKDDFANSITCGLPKIVRRTPIRRIHGRTKDNSADSRKTIPRIPNDDSVGLPQTIRKLPHRLYGNP